MGREMKVLDLCWKSEERTPALKVGKFELAFVRHFVAILNENYYFYYRKKKEKCESHLFSPPPAAEEPGY